jgi:DNA-binding NarL/FixJ family response regulator
MPKKYPKLWSKKLLVLAALLYFLLLNGIKIVEDILEPGHSIGHIVFEVLIGLMTLVAISIVWKEVLSSQERINELNANLNDVSRKYSDQLQVLRQNMTETIQAQFDQWSLTQSEQEIGFMLLKGLSFEEIGAIRQTKERTIRQQASSIYKKTGLKGRSELAAYFFEDLL